MTKPRARLTKRFRRDAQGATIVEFAIVAPVLMMMIVGIVEIGLMMGAQAMLDNAAFAASRVGKTGYSATGKTQGETIAAAVTKAASGYLDAGKITMTSKSYLDYDKIGQPEPFTDTNKNGKREASESYIDTNGNGTYDLDQGATGYGSTGSVTVYTVTYNWPLFTPYVNRFIGKDGAVKLQSLIVVKNEPYG